MRCSHARRTRTPHRRLGVTARRRVLAASSRPLGLERRGGAHPSVGDACQRRPTASGSSTSSSSTRHGSCRCTCSPGSRGTHRSPSASGTSVSCRRSTRARTPGAAIPATTPTARGPRRTRGSSTTFARDLPAVWRPTGEQLPLWRAFYGDWDRLDCVAAPATAPSSSPHCRRPGRGRVVRRRHRHARPCWRSRACPTRRPRTSTSRCSTSWRTC